MPEHRGKGALLEHVELVPTVAQVLHEDLTRLLQALDFAPHTLFFWIDWRHVGEYVFHFTEDEVRVVVDIAIVDTKEVED